MSSPAVSVILPTFNRRAWLPVAIQSVLDQSCRDLELIVVRDGGPDVADVVSSFHDDRIVFVSRDENRGKAHSLNESLARARGEFVAYLDDDDRFGPDHVGTLLNALRDNPECAAAYSDLYKVLCRVEPDGSRTPLSKRVNVRRDFDRFFLFYFNHVLHVSLMHRRDLLDRAGLYNEDLTGLIDWDIVRRLAFFTDFIHVPAVTAEYYAVHDSDDRISVRCRRDPVKYLRNVLTIRATRPPKPWPKARDAAILVVRDGVDGELLATLQNIRLWTFYPYCVYLAMPAAEFRRLPGIEALPLKTVPLDPPHAPLDGLRAAAAVADADFFVTVPPGAKIAEMWLEHALYVLDRNLDPPIAFPLKSADGAADPPIAACASTMRRALIRPAPTLRQALENLGIPLCTLEGADHPFAFDERLSRARTFEEEGAYLEAASVYAEILETPGNRPWIIEELSRVLFKLGRLDEASSICRRVNADCPTVDSLLLEARVEKARANRPRCKELLERAHSLLGCNTHETA